MSQCRYTNSALYPFLNETRTVIHLKRMSPRTQASYPIRTTYDDLNRHPVLRQTFTGHNLTQSVLHRASSSASHAGQDVAVCVQRKGYASVSQKLLDVLGVYVAGE